MIGGDRVSFRDRLDWPLFLGVVVLAVIGVINLYSATSPYTGEEGVRGGFADVYVSQVYWLVVGGLFAIVVAAIDYRYFERVAYVLYVGGIGALVLVWVLGADVRGASRWLRLGSFTFQPSEFMKLIVVLAVARYLANDTKTEARTLADFFVPMLIMGVPLGLVMAQPDFGTSMIYALSVLVMFAMTKVHRVTVLASVSLLVSSGFVLWKYIFKDYQRLRILTFLDPGKNLTGAGWHAFQSKTAIGNGGLLGEGFKEGTQNQFGFLPDQYTDFVFSVFAEDWGFAGSMALVGLYAFLCIWTVNIAAQAKDRFGAAVAVGTGAIFFWHTVFNLGMSMGVLPVVGITLPLFSYGGSSVVTTLVGFGLLMNVSMRR